MPANSSSYEKIQSKIHALKGSYPSLRTKSDDYVFSALCVKSHLFKNPALVLYENDFDEMIVDGQYDGGVDVLLTDPNSEESDMVIAQSKFYTSISADDVMNAMTKMASFFKDMSQGHYEQVNAKVQRRFLTLNAELGDESKVHFVFYTSAPQAGINRSRIEKKFREQFTTPVVLKFHSSLAKMLKKRSMNQSPGVLLWSRVKLRLILLIISCSMAIMPP